MSRKIAPIQGAARARRLWGDGPFVRFGKWPKDERSAISYAWGDVRYTHEPGISVYPVHWDSEKKRWALDCNNQRPQCLETASRHYNALAAAHPESPFYKPHSVQHDAFIVTGKIIGIGTDGEPLLRNIQIQEKVSCKGIYVPDFVFDVPEHCKEKSGNPRKKATKKKMPRKTLYIQPTQAAITAAKKGLEARKKAPKSKRGGLDTQQAKAEGVGSGVARARDIIAGKKVNAYQVKAFFDRHRQNYLNAKTKGLKPEESKAIQAWLIWGGEPLRKQAEREVAKHGKKLAKKNPYETKDKAKFIGNDTWEYRDFEIRTQRAKAPDKGFGSTIKPLRKPIRHGTKAYWLEDLQYSDPIIAPDEQSAIEMARLYIDQSYYHDALNHSDQVSFEFLREAIQKSILTAKAYSSITRAYVSRDLQHRLDELRKSPLHGKTTYEFWTGLPLKDRLAWIDSEIKLFNLARGVSLAGNPPKKKTKKKAKKNPRSIDRIVSEDARRILDFYKTNSREIYRYLQFVNKVSYELAEAYLDQRRKEDPLFDFGKVEHFDQYDIWTRLQHGWYMYNKWLDSGGTATFKRRKKCPLGESICRIWDRHLPELMAYEKKFGYAQPSEDTDGEFCLFSNFVIKHKLQDKGKEVRILLTFTSLEGLPPEAIAKNIPAMAYDDNRIIIHMPISRNVDRRIYSDIYNQLILLLKHEYEHLYQDLSFRAGSIPSSGPSYAAYLLQPVEVEAWVAGLYTKAKRAKTPIKRVMLKELSRLRLTNEERRRVKTAWEKELNRRYPRALERSREMIQVKLDEAWKRQVAMAKKSNPRKKRANPTRTAKAIAEEIKALVAEGRHREAMAVLHDYTSAGLDEEADARKIARRQYLLEKHGVWGAIGDEIALVGDPRIPNPRKKKVSKKMSRRKKNPYETKAKMQAITSNMWRYRGLRVEVKRKYAGKKVEFVATLIPEKQEFTGTELDHVSIVGDNEADLLETIRLIIDRTIYRMSLSPKDQRVFGELQAFIVTAIAHTRPPTRDGVSRFMERRFEQARKPLEDPWEHEIKEKEYMNRMEKFFHSLSVKDRLAFIDSEIKYNQLLFPPGRRNPRKKKAKKKYSPKESYEYTIKLIPSLSNAQIKDYLKKQWPQIRKHIETGVLDDSDGYIALHHAAVLEEAIKRNMPIPKQRDLNPRRKKAKKKTSRRKNPLQKGDWLEDWYIYRLGKERGYNSYYDIILSAKDANEPVDLNLLVDSSTGELLFTGVSRETGFDVFPQVEAKLDPPSRARSMDSKTRLEEYAHQAIVWFDDQVERGLTEASYLQSRLERKRGVKRPPRSSLNPPKTKAKKNPDDKKYTIEIFRGKHAGKTRTYKTLKTARRACDRLDLEYGAICCHLVRDASESENPRKKKAKKKSKTKVAAGKRSAEVYKLRKAGLLPMKEEEYVASETDPYAMQRLRETLRAELGAEEAERVWAREFNPRKKKTKKKPKKNSDVIHVDFDRGMKVPPLGNKPIEVTRQKVIAQLLAKGLIGEDDLKKKKVVVLTYREVENPYHPLVIRIMDVGPELLDVLYYGDSDGLDRLDDAIESVGGIYWDLANRTLITIDSDPDENSLWKVFLKKYRAKQQKGNPRKKNSDDKKYTIEILRGKHAGKTRTYKTLRAALRACDRLDLEYGAICCQLSQKAPESENPRKKKAKKKASKMSKRKKNPDWDYNFAKRKLQKAASNLEDAKAGGYTSEFMPGGLFPYVNAFTNTTDAIFILQRLITLKDADAQRAGRLLWAKDAAAVMRGEGRATLLLIKIIENIFHYCGLQMTEAIKQDAAAYMGVLAAPVQKSQRLWKTPPTEDSVAPTRAEGKKWLAECALVVEKWKAGQRPRMKREEQILYLLDIIATLHITAAVGAHGQRDMPPFMHQSLVTLQDAQQLLEAECKEGQRDKARARRKRRGGGQGKLESGQETREGRMRRRGRRPGANPEKTSKKMSRRTKNPSLKVGSKVGEWKIASWDSNTISLIKIEGGLQTELELSIGPPDKRHVDIEMWVYDQSGSDVEDSRSWSITLPEKAEKLSGLPLREFIVHEVVRNFKVPRGARREKIPTKEERLQKARAAQEGSRVGKTMNRYQLGIPPEEKFVLNGKSRKAKKKAAKKTAQTVPVPEIIVTRDELLLTEAYKLMREEEKRTGKPSSIDKFWDIAVAKHKPTAKELIAECQMFWEVYCKKPLKANLLQVADHCEAMKASKAKSVTEERKRCMRSVRAEAKERGWKL